MNKNKIAAAIAGLGLALSLSLTAAVGAAQAATPNSAACTAAKAQVGYAQSSLDEATPTRNLYATQVSTQKTNRQNAIKAGNVALVGQINVQLGSSTALYNSTDSAVATAQARLVQTKAAKNAAC